MTLLEGVEKIAQNPLLKISSLSMTVENGELLNKYADLDSLELRKILAKGKKFADMSHVHSL